MTIYTDSLRTLALCSVDELADLQPLADRLLAMATQARNEGLLSLEDGIYALEYPSLQVGLKLAIDGTDSLLLRQILEKRLLLSGFTGFRLRQELLILEGVIGIQEAWNPQVLQSLLTAIIAPYGRWDLSMLDKGEEIEDELERVLAKTEHLEKSTDLNVIRDLSNERLQRLLSDMDMTEMSYALLAANKAVIDRILSSVSRRAASLILSLMQAGLKEQPQRIKEAQQAILKLLGPQAP